MGEEVVEPGGLAHAGWGDDVHRLGDGTGSTVQWGLADAVAHTPHWNSGRAGTEPSRLVRAKAVLASQDYREAPAGAGPWGYVHGKLAALR
jgi:hypothetical protein